MRSTLLLLSLGSSLIALVGAAPARAGEIDAASSIDAVTVYPDGAIVTRTAAIDLPPGDSVVRFKELPLSLDPASLRVSGEGAAKIVIGAVDVNVAPATRKAADNAIAEKLTSLRDERERLRSTLEALHAKRAMIVRYSLADPNRTSGDAKLLDIGQWAEAWDAVGAALEKLGEELRPLEARAVALDGEIKALEAEQQRPSGPDAARRAAAVSLNADAAASARLTLSYRVANAGWRPAYDASLNASDSGKTVTLDRRAILTQRTGEDWSNVEVTVSTAQVSRSVGAPDVVPIKIDFWQPPIPLAASAGAAAAQSAPVAASPNAMAVPKAEQSAAAPAVGVARVAPARAIEESTSLAQASAFAAEFKVPGRITLSSDGAQKSFLLSRSDAPATVIAKSAPGLDQTAYVETRFTEDLRAPLLPGEVALHRDGAYVGQSWTAFVAPGGAVELGFGADDKIKVTRVAVNRKENEPTWYNQTKFEIREFKTTVQNLHAYPVKAQVIDQTPYSENTAIVAELMPTTTPPTEKQVGDKRGVMGWTIDLQPGETKEVHLAYRLKWPADREVTIVPEPVAQPAR